jgi:tetraacyldisaccharide 4'-kinase
MNLHPIWRALLWPFSLFYGLAVLRRGRLYRAGILKERRLPGVVISVGNLTVGGTGKTPLVMWLAERLCAEGKRVGILTRGYKGTRRTSDEVELMRRRWGNRIPIAVGSRRWANGLQLAQEGVNCFLLDDGFQHLALARDVDIVLLDATDSLGRARLLPVGRLREPLSALRRADIVVITRVMAAPELEAQIRSYTDAPLFYARSRLLDFCGLTSTAGKLSPREMGMQKVFAFCGIGNPKAFFCDLAKGDISLAGREVFRDHHRYTQTDVDRLENAASRAGAAALVCTEKDAMNLRDAEFHALPVYVCRAELEIAGDLLETVLRLAVPRTVGAS